MASDITSKESARRRGKGRSRIDRCLETNVGIQSRTLTSLIPSLEHVKEVKGRIQLQQNLTPKETLFAILILLTMVIQINIPILTNMFARKIRQVELVGDMYMLTGVGFFS